MTTVSEQSVVISEKSEHFKKKWTDNILHIRKDWYFKLVFISTLLQFHANYLKDSESSLGWAIIVITSVTSFITLVEFTSIGLSDEINIYYLWGRSIFISLLSVITTLLASWIKKNQFIKRIKDLDKRVYQIEKTKGLIASVIDRPINDRDDYTKFYNNNIKIVLDLCNFSSLISPIEINYSLYNITKNYPNLIRNIPPWYTISTIDNNEIIFKPDINFGNNIIRNYEAQKNAKNCCHKIFSCYFCCCKCFKNMNDGNPFTLNYDDLFLEKRDSIFFKDDNLNNNSEDIYTTDDQNNYNSYKEHIFDNNSKETFSLFTKKANIENAKNEIKKNIESKEIDETYEDKELLKTTQLKPNDSKKVKEDKKNKDNKKTKKRKNTKKKDDLSEQKKLQTDIEIDVKEE